METEKQQSLVDYIDLQAELGITKHIGGITATDILLERCHVREAKEVLYVGTGIGAGPAYIARHFPCRVVGVDLSEKMIEWSRRRAKEDHIEDRTEFHVADMREMPFTAGRFDAVLIESVVVFVPDKDRAIAECARVLRPGGWLGMNETLWFKDPPQEIIDGVRTLGSNIPTEAEWRALWEQSGLTDQEIEIRTMELAREARDRIQWIGTGRVLKAWGRLISLYTSGGELVRRSIKEQMRAIPTSVIEYMGYGLFTGRKPSSL